MPIQRINFSFDSTESSLRIFILLAMLGEHYIIKGNDKNNKRKP